MVPERMPAGIGRPPSGGIADLRSRREKTLSDAPTARIIVLCTFRCVLYGASEEKIINGGQE